jgi:hypothetical protein
VESRGGTFVIAGDDGSGFENRLALDRLTAVR